MTKIADRIDKLRRMAEHPTSNPHEAAIARAEMERLLKAHPNAKPSPPPARARVWSPSEAIWDRLVREASCFICGIKLNYGWASDVSIHRCPKHLGILVPGDNGYYEWARGLNVGDALMVHGDRGEPCKRERVSYAVTIERMTSTQYVMTDGTRFRRSGQFPGYKVGETGREGRTYLIRRAVTGAGG